LDGLHGGTIHILQQPLEVLQNINTQYQLMSGSEGTS
jgi:hypothetical protein